MNVQHILNRVLHTARDTPTFKKNKRIFGLSLAQYEECITYILLVLLGAKQAYLMSASLQCDGIIGADCEVSPQEYCLHVLVENLQRQIEGLCVPFVQLVCVCIPASDHDHIEDACDFLIVRRCTLSRKIDELKCGIVREHPFIIDVSGLVPTSVHHQQATECLLKCFGTFGDSCVRSIPMKVDRFIPAAADLASLRNEVGVCLLAGWLLGYPVLYQHGQCARESSSSLGNALSMQELRKYCITVPTSALLEFGPDKCASIKYEPNLLRFCTGCSLAVFEFTVPLALMEACNDASFDSALQAQMALVQSVLGSVDMSSSVFVEPHIMM